MYATGANKSKYDIRTFTYVPTKANIKGGTRYNPEDIEDQHRVGICTAIHLTMNAKKALGIPFNADFQYLLQKKFIDGNWDEGSSLFSAVKVGKNYGFLPESEWKHTTEQDRLLNYSEYIKKLQAIPDSEITRLLTISANYKLKGYANVPIDRDIIANAIDESKSGVLTRFVVGSEWWTSPIEPIRPPANIISGHAIVMSNYDGNSYRLANTWGTSWADKGTAYSNYTLNKPTEAWIPYYNELPKPIEQQLESRASIIGKIMDYLQKIIELLPKLA